MLGCSVFKMFNIFGFRGLKFQALQCWAATLEDVWLSFCGQDVEGRGYPQHPFRGSTGDADKRETYHHDSVYSREHLAPHHHRQQQQKHQPPFVFNTAFILPYKH